MHLLGAALLDHLGRLAERAGCVADIVDDDAALAFDTADHGHFRYFAGLFSALVDDGEGGVDPLGKLAGAGDAADIRRNDHHLAHLLAKLFLDIEGEDRRGIEVVDRNVEEPLDLGGMQVHGQHPLDPRADDHVRHQLGRDRRARLGATVLAGIAEIGDHGGDARSRGAAQRIGHDQKLHQVVVGGIRGRLDDEHVLAPDVVVYLDENLAVVEAFDPGVDQLGRDAAMQRHAPGNGLGKGQIRIARNELRFFGGRHVQSDPRAVASSVR